MQNISQLTLLNRKPTITISHEGLQAIKHIVSIAPQEAQWFHTVTPVVYENIPDEIFLELSTKLYIPKQTTSSAEVDSNSSMMIEFYNELKNDYQDQQVINEKLSAMTCWCHSHHNMAPNPSNQDDLQFNSFINLANDQDSKSWQIMLIFNKANKFYSRVYDPHTGAIFEGVDILVENEYDFSYIDKAAKEKFIKKTFSFSKKPKLSSHLNASWLSNPIFTPNKSYLDLATPSQNMFLNEEIALDIFADVFTAKTKEELFALPDIKLTSTLIQALFQSFCSRMDDKEVNHFISLALNDFNSVLKTFTDYGYSKYGIHPQDQLEAFSQIFHHEVNLKKLYLNCVTTLDIADCDTKKEVQNLFAYKPATSYNKLNK